MTQEPRKTAENHSRSLAKLGDVSQCYIAKSDEKLCEKGTLNQTTDK
jgi:predicted transcriptional regulator